MRRAEKIVGQIFQRILRCREEIINYKYTSNKVEQSVSRFSRGRLDSGIIRRPFAYGTLPRRGAAGVQSKRGRISWGTRAGQILGILRIFGMENCAATEETIIAGIFSLLLFRDNRWCPGR